MKKLFLLSACICFWSAGNLQAQDYTTALGLRLGPYYGVSLKHFFSVEKAGELILVTREQGVGITGLYEFHTSAFNTPRLQAYGGIGGHLNMFNSNKRKYWDWDDEPGNRSGDDREIHIGLDMILGIEYTLTELPFMIGLDWKPAINLIGDQGYSTNQLALSFRFVFK